MTQKELLYFEDAIGHVSNIISILKSNINNLENLEIKNFLESEIEIHNNRKENLINFLKEQVNE